MPNRLVQKSEFKTKNDDYMDTINSVIDQDKKSIYSTSPSNSNPSSPSSILIQQTINKYEDTLSPSNSNKREINCITLDEINKNFSKRIKKNSQSDEAFNLKDNKNIERHSLSDNESSTSLNPSSVKNFKEFEDENSNTQTSNNHIQNNTNNTNNYESDILIEDSNQSQMELDREVERNFKHVNLVESCDKNNKGKIEKKLKATLFILFYFNKIFLFKLKI